MVTKSWARIIVRHFFYALAIVGWLFVLKSIWLAWVFGGQDPTNYNLHGEVLLELWLAIGIFVFMILYTIWHKAFEIED